MRVLRVLMSVLPLAAIFVLLRIAVCGSIPQDARTFLMQTISPGIIGVVFDDRREKVLLHQLRDNGVWSLPGGRPDFGESFVQTTEREVHEETGLVVQA